MTEKQIHYAYPDAPNGLLRHALDESARMERLAYAEALKAGFAELEARQRAINISYLAFCRCLKQTPPSMYPDTRAVTESR